ncbi:hypothetical protein NPX98_06570, partial [Bartonella sp. A5(2022)]|nr:hypothetical protein [Bartonella sp. A05]
MSKKNVLLCTVAGTLFFSCYSPTYANAFDNEAFYKKLLSDDRVAEITSRIVASPYSPSYRESLGSLDFFYRLASGSKIGNNAQFDQALREELNRIKQHVDGTFDTKQRGSFLHTQVLAHMLGRIAVNARVQQYNQEIEDQLDANKELIQSNFTNGDSVISKIVSKNLQSIASGGNIDKNTQFNELIEQVLEKVKKTITESSRSGSHNFNHTLHSEIITELNRMKESAQTQQRKKDIEHQKMAKEIIEQSKSPNNIRSRSRDRLDSTGSSPSNPVDLNSEISSVSAPNLSTASFQAPTTQTLARSDGIPLSDTVTASAETIRLSSESQSTVQSSTSDVLAKGSSTATPNLTATVSTRSSNTRNTAAPLTSTSVRDQVSTTQQKEISRNSSPSSVEVERVISSEALVGATPTLSTAPALARTEQENSDKEISRSSSPSSVEVERMTSSGALVGAAPSSSPTTTLSPALARTEQENSDSEIPVSQTSISLDTANLSSEPQLQTSQSQDHVRSQVLLHKTPKTQAPNSNTVATTDTAIQVSSSPAPSDTVTTDHSNSENLLSDRLDSADIAASSPTTTFVRTDSAHVPATPTETTLQVYDNTRIYAQKESFTLNDANLQNSKITVTAGEDSTVTINGGTISAGFLAFFTKNGGNLDAKNVHAKATEIGLLSRAGAISLNGSTVTVEGARESYGIIFIPTSNIEATEQTAQSAGNERNANIVTLSDTKIRVKDGI